jgi:MYXO-CTERM domain-containing protein
VAFTAKARALTMFEGGEGRMNMRRLHAVGIAGLVMGGLAWYGASPAQACSCAATTRVVWPAAAATDVARRPNLVVASLLFSSHELEVVLQKADGTRVPVEPTGNPELSMLHVCEGIYQFFRPAEVLDPNTTYSLRVEPGHDPELGHVNIRESTFTTGEELTEAGPGTPAPYIKFHRLYGTGCAASDAWCRDLVEASVSGPTAESPALSWLRLSQGDGRESLQVFTLGVPPSAFQPYRQVMPVFVDEPCLDYAWIDATGATLASGQLCEPEKCARLSADSLILHNSCGEVYFDGVDWSELAEDSCEDPPVLDSGSDAGSSPDVDAGAPEPEGVGSTDGASEIDDRARSSQVGLCSFQLTSGSPLPLAWLVLLAAPLLRRRR